MVDATPPSIGAARPHPAGHLALGRRRQGRGAVVSAIVHGAIIVVLFWKGARLLAPGGGGAGPRGGGGGGSEAAHFFLLAGAAPRAAVPLPNAPVVVATHIPLPDPVKVEVPKVETPQAATTTTATTTAASNGTTGGPGEGSGTGGGKGTGAGTGTGSEVGPGTGGAAGYILSASPRLTILPPQCFHGHVQARFSVTMDGRVADVELAPVPKNGECRESMLRQFRDYLFFPARTRDGQPVASIYQISLAQ